jgi:hypothetical protein
MSALRRICIVRAGIIWDTIDNKRTAKPHRAGRLVPTSLLGRLIPTCQFQEAGAACSCG